MTKETLHQKLLNLICNGMDMTDTDDEYNSERY